MKPNSIAHRMTKLLLDIMFYLGIVWIVLSPFLARMCGRWFYGNGYASFWHVNGVVWPLSGLLGVSIVFFLRKMFRSLLGGDPFIEENVKSFQTIAFLCGGISVLYFIKCGLMLFSYFYLFSVSSVMIAAVFFIGMLFCFTLQYLFAQAVCYKQENDLTI